MERTTFVPAVMSACGGMGKAASALFKRIAAVIAEKKGGEVSVGYGFH